MDYHWLAMPGMRNLAPDIPQHMLELHLQLHQASTENTAATTKTARLLIPTPYRARRRRITRPRTCTTRSIPPTTTHTDDEGHIPHHQQTRQGHRRPQDPSTRLTRKTHTTEPTKRDRQTHTRNTTTARTPLRNNTTHTVPPNQTTCRRRKC